MISFSIRSLTTLALVFFLNLTFGQTINRYTQNSRTVALLDVMARNNETGNGEVYALSQILKIAGIPYIETTNVNVAAQYGFIISSSRLNNATFLKIERDTLTAFVNRGGIFIAPNVQATNMFNLFGLTNAVTNNTMHRITFDTVLAAQECRWLDDTAEVTISLGKLAYATTIPTRVYSVNASGKVIGRYETNDIAIVRNSFGNGTTYALPASYKQLIQFPQMNKDYEAQRIYSNGFEPSADAVTLFIKGIYNRFVQNATWTHTIPGTSLSALMITHDVDSRTAYDTMGAFADYEYNMGYRAHYLLTTRYIHDDWMTDFYDANSSTSTQVNDLLNKNHILGSHSVMHLPDFDNEARFPLGTRGLNKDTYLPFYSGIADTTIGGSVYGETEVSKSIIETDYPVTVKTFRSGYLLYNKKMVNALDSLGYRYNSSFSACDVLSNFPYRSRYDLNSEGLVATNLWEVPMTISDVFPNDPINDGNYSQKVSIWLDVINRTQKNYAPSVLLIHPNRMWKVQAQMDFISQLPAGVLITDLETYGDYWRARDTFKFTSNRIVDTVTITIPANQFPLHPGISIVVDKGQELAAVKVLDSNGNPVTFYQNNWETNSLILTFGTTFARVTSAPAEEYISELKVNCYPNPFTEKAFVDFTLVEGSDVTVTISDITGKTAMTLTSGYYDAGKHSLNLNASSLKAGIYFCKVKAGNFEVTRKLVCSK
jgi:hypothetical protein